MKYKLIYKCSNCERWFENAKWIEASKKDVCPFCGSNIIKASYNEEEMQNRRLKKCGREEGTE